MTVSPVVRAKPKFLINSILDCAGKKLDLSQPRVMGIVNVTPNSFSATGRFTSPTMAVAHAHRLVAEGAAIIDVGGEPSNPTINSSISVQEELDRVMPVLELLCQEISVPVSIDTSKPEVMREALRVGVNLINDIRALRNPAALKLLAQTKVPVCIMHMAFPEGRAVNEEPAYNNDNIVVTVKNFLQQQIQHCLAAGIAKERIIIDPGIGHGSYGKNLQQNLLLLNHLDEFKKFGLPILVGVSRKTFIGELLNLPEQERLYGSLAASVIAVTKGANIVRAHDVKATVEALKIAQAITAVSYY